MKVDKDKKNRRILFWMSDEQIFDETRRRGLLRSLFDLIGELRDYVAYSADSERELLEECGLAEEELGAPDLLARIDEVLPGLSWEEAP